MENILQEPKQEKINPSKKINRYAVITGIIILFSIPLLLIVFKPSAKVAEITGSTTGGNLTSLENDAKKNPSYANLFNLSVSYINTNQPARAIPYLKEALKKEPKSSKAFNNLGVAYIMLRNYGPAIENCEKAIALDSSFALAKNNLKWAIAEKNKVLISLQGMEKTAEEKRDIKYYVDAGIKYLSIGDYEDCVATCNYGLLKNPGNTILLNNVGTALMMQRKYEGAMVQFQQILEKDASNQLAKNNLAWAINEKKLNP